MMWLFAGLIVLAMGGVAMLAAGHGAPLREEDGTLPGGIAVPGSLPEQRPLRAQDLRAARFSLGLRGYRMAEVDALLDRVASEWESRSVEEKSPELSENDPPP